MIKKSDHARHLCSDHTGQFIQHEIESSLLNKNIITQNVNNHNNIIYIYINKYTTIISLVTIMFEIIIE